MRSSKQRSRAKPNRPRTMGNIVNRVFDSSGPEGKVRGTPQQIIEKYQFLARDAQLSNDRVAYENFLQHSEHYTRMLGEATRELQREADERRDSQGQPRGGDPSDMRYDGQPRDAQFREDRDDDGGDADPYVDAPRPQQNSQPRPQHQPRPQQLRTDQERFQPDRSGDRNGDRQPDRNGDRQPDRNGDRQPDRNGDRQPDRNGDRQPDRNGDRQPQERQPDRQPQERQPQERQPRERPSHPRPVVDRTGELPAFISAPLPKTDRPLPDRPPLPDRSPLADVIELDDDRDRDTDSGLVETPEMPSDENPALKAASRKRTPRKPKPEAAAAVDAPSGSEPENAAE